MYAKIARASLLAVAVTAVLSGLAYVACPHPAVKQWGLVLAFLICFAAFLRQNAIFRFLECTKQEYKFTCSAQLQNRISHLIDGLGVQVEVGHANLDQVNAFAAYDPIQRKGIIAFTPALEANATDDELLALAAHEVAHIKNNDTLNKYFVIAFQNLLTAYPHLTVYILKKMVEDKTGKAIVGLSMLSMLILVLSGSGTVWDIVLSAYTAYPPLQYLTVLIFLNFLLDFVLRYFHHSYSRDREYEADRVGAELTSIDDMISGIRLLGSFEEPRTVSVFDTHPPTETRIARLMQAAA